MPVTFALALVSFAGTLAYLVMFVALHLLPSGYDPVHHAVSDYGQGRLAPLFRAALWASAVGVLLLAAALFAGVGAPPLAARDLVLLAAAALTRVGMSVFPTDLEGQRLTPTGALHYLFAVLTFGLTYTALSNLTPALRTLDPWRPVGRLLGVLATLVLVSLVLVVVTMFRPLRAAFGLCERAFLITTNLWLAVVELLLLIESA